MKKTLLILVAVVVVVLCGLFLLNNKNVEDPTPKNTVPVANVQAKEPYMSDIKEFYSKQVGVSFSYDANSFVATEEGGAVYVNGIGENLHLVRVEKITKSKTVSFKDSIKKLISKENYSDKCQINVLSGAANIPVLIATNATGSTQSAKLGYSYSKTDLDSGNNFYGECGGGTYGIGGSSRFFVYNDKFPDTFYFLDMGQAPVLESKPTVFATK